MAIYKRGKGKNAIYYYRAKIGRDAILRSLKTSNAREAERAAAILDKELRQNEALRRIRCSSPTIAEIVRVYLPAQTLGAKKTQTRALNIRALYSILRHAGSKQPHEMLDEDCQALNISVLAPELVVKWQVHETSKGRSRNSINSSLSQAKSVFSKDALELYKASKLKVAEFVKDFKNIRKFKVRPVVSFQPFSKETLRKIELEIVRLWISPLPADNEQAKVIVLALRFGLRAIEIYEAKRWQVGIDTADGLLGLTVGATKYGNARIVYLDPKDPENAPLVEMFPLPQAQEKEQFLVAHDFPKTERHNLIYRDTNSILRPILRQPTEQARGKLLHALRKQFGSVLATTKGLFVAQKALGHRSPQLTSDYYANLTEKVMVPKVTV
jgi:integrase